MNLRSASDAPRAEVALVTGASSGIGRAIAHALAPHCGALILVARRAEPLRLVAEEVTALSGAQAHCISCDLGRPNAARDLYDQVRERALAPSILVNNAGVSLHAPFLGGDVEWIRRIMYLNAHTLTELTYLYASDMVKSGHGRILQIASMAAYQPTPFNSLYAATKALVASLGEALSCELQGTGVSVTTVYPWKTSTDLYKTSGAHDPRLFRKLQVLPAEVARVAVPALLRGDVAVTIGKRNKSVRALVKLLPRRWSTNVAGYLMKQALHL